MLRLPRGEDMETVSRPHGMTAVSLARRPTGGEVLGSERPNARLGGVLLD